MGLEIEELEELEDDAGMFALIYYNNANKTYILIYRSW